LNEVKRLNDSRDRAVVVHERAPMADEKALGLHHFEVEDRLDLTPLDAQTIVVNPFD
jgi:hypothetical protein